MTIFHKQDDAKQLHELRDMLVEEVSLVDRAANKRRFLLVKRQDGQLMMTDDDLMAKTDEESDEEKRAKATTEDDEEKSEKAGAKADAEDDEEKAAKADGLKSKLAARVDALAAKLKALPDENVPPALAAELKSMADAVAAQSGPPAAGDKASKSEIEKAGARMSKDRYARFKQAVSLLQSVFSEVSPPLDAGVKAKAKAAAKMEEEEDDEEKTKGKKSRTKKSAEPSVEQLLGSLTDAVSSMGHAIAATNDKVEHIAKSRGMSHVLGPEGGGAPRKEKVSWPVDMTRPQGRENVAKEKFWG